ncbi:MAG: AAA family ATPase [Candidatus Thiodiazotropha sp.]
MTEPNEFFSTPEISAHLDLIRHLIENSELVPLVRGASGSGKTLLASKLQQSAPDDWVVCHFSADPTLQPDRLLAFIARCNGLPDIAGELLQRLVARFEIMRKRGRIPVVLVDDAQMLPPTSLMTLLRLFERQVDGVRLVSIVLFANEQIDHLLATPQLQVMSPQVIQAIDMPVLTLRQAVDFMHFVLKGEGLSEHFALDDGKLARAHKETGGVPGLLATEILNDVGRKGETQASIFTTYRHQLVMYGVPLLTVIVLLLLFQGPINRMFEPGSLAEQKTEPSTNSGIQTGEPIRLPLPAEGDTRIASLPGEKPLSEPEAERAPLSQVSPPAVVPVPQSGAVSDEPTVQKSVFPNSTDQTRQADQQSKPGTQDTQSEPPLSGEVGRGSALAGQTESPELASAAKPEPEPVEENALLVEKPLDVPVEPEPVDSPEISLEKTSLSDSVAAEASPVPSVQREKTPAPAAKPEPEAVSPGINSPLEDAQEWIAAQPSENYTLQLVAVENVESLQSFIRMNGLQGKVHTHQTLRKGVAWYSLLWGSFESRDLALQAQTQLPAAIQKSGVWVRSFGSIR